MDFHPELCFDLSDYMWCLAIWLKAALNFARCLGFVLKHCSTSGSFFADSRPGQPCQLIVHVYMILPCAAITLPLKYRHSLHLGRIPLWINEAGGQFHFCDFCVWVIEKNERVQSVWFSTAAMACSNCACNTRWYLLLCTVPWCWVKKP